MKTLISDQPLERDNNAGDLRQQIETHARDEGFDVVGFTTPDAIVEAGSYLGQFLNLGRHGSMGWMERNAGRRADPRVLWPDVGSIVVVAVSYAPAHNPLDDLSHKGHGIVSVYARGHDYHDVLKKRLKRLGRWTGEVAGCGVKVFVDTAPVMEKPLAAAAGIGWQGKHTNLVSRSHGSWLFLGVMMLDIGLDASEPDNDRCGSCRACLDVCPTNAFPAAYQLDARRCISYLTIEHKGHIDLEFRAAMANRIFGCDDCLAVCPWNKFASAAHDQLLAAREEFIRPDLEELSRLDDPSFRKLFSDTSIQRTGRDRFIRNVMIAIGNSGDVGFLTCVKARLDDVSPLVRAMAVWALGELTSKADADKIARQYCNGECDEAVLAEWARIMPGSMA
jgi:epoxyqueuosine reductase